jgi:Xaa-Pro aminopeptidase
MGNCPVFALSLSVFRTGLQLEKLFKKRISVAEKKIMTGWKRIHKLQEAARQMLLSGILIHSNENIYYLTSVYPHEPSFLIIPSHSEPRLVAARSIFAEAKKDCLIPVIPGDLDIAETAYQIMLEAGVLKTPPTTLLKSFIRKVAEPPIGIEHNHLSVFLLDKFNIRNYLDITPVIMNLRSKKDSFEIDYIKSSCLIADKSMLEVKKAIRPGASEKELSGIFDATAKAMGADEAKCRVRSGKNTALPFSRWMDENLDQGPLLIDYGVRIKGYWSDITRMFYLGQEPDAKFVEIYELVLRARNRALEMMEPGKSIHGPETAIRDVFKEKGYLDNMVYTAGHGIGLEVHEPPILSLPFRSRTDADSINPQRESISTSFTRDKDEEVIFERGQVFALEPGIYLNEIGVRVEDMVHVSEKPTLLSTLSTRLDDIIISL